MAYVVVKDFHDLADRIETKGGVIYHEYHKGDIYPRIGVDEVSEERIKELSGTENRQGTPLIAPVTPAVPDEAEKEPKKAGKKKEG